MLKARKRITKRQMKEDKLVTYYFKAADYLQQNSRNLAWGIGAMAIVILAIFIYSRKELENEQNAVVALAEARTEYFRNNYAAAAEKLQILVDSYGGTKSGKLGLFYLANSKFHLKAYDEAERLFRDYLAQSDDDVLKASAMSGVAACLEEQGKTAEAASRYEEAAERFGKGFMAPENMFHAARCYLLSGDSIAAKSILEALINEYSSSPIKSDAEVLLAELRS